jgi:hypothetical protein
MEMAVRSMETAETAMETDGDGCGTLSHPGRVPEQRLLSPKIHLRRWRSCRTLSGNLPILLGFSVLRLYIGAMGGRGQGLGHAPCSVGGLWPPFGSLSVFGTLLGKIRLLELVSSNYENISCVAFLNHKNSRKHGTDTVVTC